MPYTALQPTSKPSRPHWKTKTLCAGSVKGLCFATSLSRAETLSNPWWFSQNLNQALDLIISTFILRVKISPFLRFPLFCNPSRTYSGRYWASIPMARKKRVVVTAKNRSGAIPKQSTGLVEPRSPRAYGNQSVASRAPSGGWNLGPLYSSHGVGGRLMKKGKKRWNEDEFQYFVLKIGCERCQK